jgi:hypothetical protein
VAELSHGLLFPSAHQESEVHLSRARPARLVPPSGFVYPLDGLLPRNPCRFYFTPAALVGFTLRRLTFPCGLPEFITSAEPTYRLTQRFSDARRIKPARRASISGFTPHGIAWKPRLIRPLASKLLPWVYSPSGLVCKSLRRTSPAILSRA